MSGTPYSNFWIESWLYKSLLRSVYSILSSDLSLVATDLFFDTDINPSIYSYSQSAALDSQAEYLWWFQLAEILWYHVFICL